MAIFVHIPGIANQNPQNINRGADGPAAVRREVADEVRAASAMNREDTVSFSHAVTASPKFEDGPPTITTETGHPATPSRVEDSASTQYSDSGFAMREPPGEMDKSA